MTSDNTEIIYSSVMVVLVVIGFAVNIGSIVLLMRRKHKTMFHTLLKILAFYDLFVMAGCLTLYSLPSLIPDSNFVRRIHPHLLPWLLPTVQIAMMTSIYCTIVMSFERYIRICHLCQLKTSKIITEENFWIYVVCFLVCPILFYMPKFFEIRTTTEVRTYNFTLNCTGMLTNQEPSNANTNESFQQLTTALQYATKNGSAAAADPWEHEDESSPTPFPLYCLNYFNVSNSESDDASEDYIRVVERRVSTLQIAATPLRQNRLYYEVYCIVLNTIFASVVPLLSLIYLNICTVLALRKMGQNLETNSSVHTMAMQMVRMAINHVRTTGGKVFRRANADGNGIPPQLEERRRERDSCLAASFNEDNEIEVDKREELDEEEEEDSVLGIHVCEVDEEEGNNHHKSKNPIKDDERPTSSRRAMLLLARRVVSRSRSTEDLERGKTSTASIKLFDKKGAVSSLRSSLRSQHRPSEAGGASQMSPTATAIVNNSQCRRSSTTLMRKQENRLTRISLSIVSLFVACHVWRLIPTAFEAIRHFSEADGSTVLSRWPLWLVHVNHISHTLIVFNSAVNFLLYIIW